MKKSYSPFRVIFVITRFGKGHKTHNHNYRDSSCFMQNTRSHAVSTNYG